MAEPVPDNGPCRSEAGILAAVEDAHLRMLRRRTVLLLVAVALVPLAVLGGGAWLAFERVIADATDRQLRTVVGAHASAIELFLAERTMALRLIAREYDKERLGNQPALARVFHHLDEIYGHSFLDLGVIDDEGRHLAYIGPYDLLDKNYRGTPWFARVAQQGVYVSDVFLGFRNEPHFVIAVRRDEPDGHFWILRASVNPDVFARLVARGRLGRTGDCFLLDREARLQTPSAEVGAVYEASGIPLPPSQPVLETFRARGKDGRTVVRTVKWIKDGEWLLVAQQDEREIRAPIRAAMWRGAVVLACGVGAVIGAAILSTRHLIRLIERGSRERDHLNRQLLQASKLASLGEMSVGLAHEINNPLAIIHSAQVHLADLLEDAARRGTEVGEMRDVIRITRKQIDRCKSITQRMLQFGWQGVSAPEWIEPARQIREIVQLVLPPARNQGVDLCFEASPDLPELFVDPTELQQVVTNLVANAVQALDGPGAVVVSAWKEGDDFHLAVEDTGPGIPYQHLEKIFEPFFTTKPAGKGTGLGLSVCYGIVEKWRGRIRATSRPGQGALFHLWFPVPKAGDWIRRAAGRSRDAEGERRAN